MPASSQFRSMPFFISDASVSRPTTSGTSYLPLMRSSARATFRGAAADGAVGEMSKWSMRRYRSVGQEPKKVLWFSRT